MLSLGEMPRKFLAAAAGLVLIGTGGVAQAIVILPGPAGQPDISFQDNAFADVLLSSSGVFDVNPPGSTLESVLTDTSLETSAFSFSPGAFVELGFTDNLAVDGASADIALYDLGIPRGTFDITIGGVTLQRTSQATATTNLNGIEVNILLIDLADFGVISASSLLIGMDILSNGGLRLPPDLALVAAINNAVPAPGVLALMGIALAGLGAVCRLNKLAL
jgi:hypothetical protein